MRRGGAIGRCGILGICCGTPGRLVPRFFFLLLARINIRKLLYATCDAANGRSDKLSCRVWMDMAGVDTAGRGLLSYR